MLINLNTFIFDKIEKVLQNNVDITKLIEELSITKRKLNALVIRNPSWYFQLKDKIDTGHVLKALGNPEVTDNELRYYNKEGQLHRDDGPAVIYSNGTLVYYKEGKIHRDDGPAIVYSDGYKAYYKESQRHRDDGPAVLRPDGTLEYYKEDIRLSEAEFLKRQNPAKINVPEGYVVKELPDGMFLIMRK